MSTALAPATTTVNTTLKLYQLPELLREIDQALDESGGEITPEIGAALDAYQGTLADRVDGLVYLIREAEAAALACEAAAKPLLERQRSHEARAGRLKEYLRSNLETLQETKVKTPRSSVSVLSAQPSIQVTCDPAELPERFVRLKLEPDKKALAEVLRAGGELPAGVNVTVTRYLRIY